MASFMGSRHPLLERRESAIKAMKTAKENIVSDCPIVNSVLTALRVDDPIERNECLARVASLNLPAYLDDSALTASDYGLLRLFGMLSVNVGISHISGTCDLVIASTFDEHVFVRAVEAEAGGFLFVRDSRDDKTLSQVFAMPVHSSRYLNQDTYSPRYGVRRIKDGRAHTSYYVNDGHRLKLFLSPCLAQAYNLRALARRRAEKQKTINLFGALPPSQVTLENAARQTGVSRSGPVVGRRPLDTVPRDKLRGHLRPIPTLYGAFVLGAPTSDDVKRPEFVGLAIRRHIVRWLLSYAENEFECCVGLYSGDQFFSLMP